MPITPYHFGPSGFAALTFRKWLDVPVFVLANVIVDIEVLVVRLFNLGWRAHPYCHTLLIGAVLGLLWGVAAWPLRRVFAPVMNMLRIPYEPHRLKMVAGGVLGVWLHVLLDGMYHWDVRVFWPGRSHDLWLHVQRHLNKSEIELLCLLFVVPTLISYIVAVRSFYKDRADSGPAWKPGS